MIKRCNENKSAEPADESKLSPKLPKLFWGAHLTRNLCTATLLLCCAIGARDVMVNSEQTALEVLQTAVKSEWDENIGRLMYVNSSLSDAIAVFSPSAAALYQPSTAEVIDVFSDAAPYIVYGSAGKVYAAARGEVMSVDITNEHTYTVRLRCNDATECVYYGLKNCIVSEGDTVAAYAVIGDCEQNDLYFEVRKNGAPVDASALFIPIDKE